MRFKLRKLFKENYDAPEWFGRYLDEFNQFVEDLQRLLTKRLTIADNLKAQVKEITFETSASYDGTAANFTPFSFDKEMVDKAQGVVILQAALLDDGNYTPIEGAVHIDWRDVNGQIRVGLVTGLAPSKRYQLRLMVV